jgi:hypothetical protein
MNQPRNKTEKPEKELRNQPPPNTEKEKYRDNRIRAEMFKIKISFFSAFSHVIPVNSSFAPFRG